VSLALRNKNSGSVSVGQYLPKEQDIVRNAGKKDGKEQTGKTRENIGFNVIQLSLFPMS
jgi:hypothetical protein